MSGLSYETVSRFAQQGGTIYFGVMFFVGVVYALWPSRKATYQKLAYLPLEDDGGDHV